MLLLSDGTEEAWAPEKTRVGPDAALYAVVKEKAPGGPFEAKFTSHAQASIAPALVEVDETDGPAVRVGARAVAIGAGAR